MSCVFRRVRDTAKSDAGLSAVRGGRFSNAATGILINRAGIFNSQFSCHVYTWHISKPRVNAKY